VDVWIRINTRILDLGTSWRKMVSFTPRPIYPRGKSPGYPLGEPQNRSGPRGEQKILDPTGTRTPTPLSSSPQPVPVLTALSRLLNFSCTGCPKSLDPMGILFMIYYLHYMLYMFTPTLYAFSQPLFAQHIGIDSSTIICKSLPKVTKISDFNSIHHPWRPLRSTISTLSSNVNAIFRLITYNFNLEIKIREMIEIPIGSRLFGHSV
jgi:hypothetical protein